MPDGSQYPGNGTSVVFTLANMVTFARLCAVPLAFLLVLEHRLAEAFFLFVAAGVSDAVDGWLARRYGGNAIGAVLDPVADKTLLVTMYVTLAAVGVIPVWLAILVGAIIPTTFTFLQSHPTPTEIVTTTTTTATLITEQKVSVEDKTPTAVEPMPKP